MYKKLFFLAVSVFFYSEANSQDNSGYFYSYAKEYPVLTDLIMESKSICGKQKTDDKRRYHLSRLRVISESTKTKYLDVLTKEKQEHEAFRIQQKISNDEYYKSCTDSASNVIAEINKHGLWLDFDSLDEIDTAEKERLAFNASVKKFPELANLIDKNPLSTREEKYAEIITIQFATDKQREFILKNQEETKIGMQETREIMSRVIDMDVRISKDLIEEDPFIVSEILRASKQSSKSELQTLIDIFEYAPKNIREELSPSRSQYLNDLNEIYSDSESQKALDLITERVLKHLLLDKGFIPKETPRNLKYVASVDNQLAFAIKNASFLNNNHRGFNSRNYQIALANFYSSNPNYTSHIAEHKRQLQNLTNKHAQIRAQNRANASYNSQYALGEAAGIALLYGAFKLFTSDVGSSSGSSYSYNDNYNSSNHRTSSTNNRGSYSQNKSGTKDGSYRFTENLKYSSGQKVVARGRCSDETKFDIRYSPNTGAAYRYSIYSTSGSSKEAVAAKFCKNH